MPNNKAPIDAYSADEHMEVRDEYEQNEAAISSARDEHLGDILAHHELMSEAERGFEYPLQAELDTIVDNLNREVEPLLEKRKNMMAELTRLEANKRRVDNEQETRRVMETVCTELPAFKQQAEDMAQALGTNDAARRAREVADLIEQTIKDAKRRPVDYHAVEHSVQTVFEGLQWLKSSRSSLDTNRYGRDLTA